MFLLTQCKLIADFFLSNKNFYNKTALSQALAEIAGATDYESARANLFLLCENLQLVIKFTLGFLDYEKFIEICNDVGMLDFNLPNKPFLAESHIQNGGSDLSKEVFLFFKVPDIETSQEKKLRTEQIKIILKFVLVDAFKEEAAKLRCKLNHPRIKLYDDELSVICANLKSFFYQLQALRRFAIMNVAVPINASSPDKEIDAIINAAKDNVLTCLDNLRPPAEGLKQNLDFSSRPTKPSTPTYFYRLQLVNDEIHDFSRKINLFHPNKKVLMLASEELRDDNLYPALKQIIDGYKNSLAYVVNFASALPKITNKSNAYIKRKIKNLRRFNLQYPALVQQLLIAISAFDAAFPIAFKILPELTPANTDNIGCKLMVIARDLTEAQLPVHEGINLKLINDDTLLLAHADIAISIISLAAFLKNLLADFNYAKSLTKSSSADIEDLLATLTKEKFSLLQSYESLTAKIQGNKFKFEKNSKFLPIYKSIHEEVIPEFSQVKNLVFDIFLNNQEQVQQLIFAIKTVSEKIAETQKTISAFTNMLPMLERTGNTLKENHAQFSGIFQTLTQNVATLKSSYQTLLTNVVLADQKTRVTSIWTQIIALEALVIAAFKTLGPLSQIDNSNLFQSVTNNMLTLKLNIKTAESNAEKIQSALDEENRLLGTRSLVSAGFAGNPNRLQFNPVPCEATAQEEPSQDRVALAVCFK